MKLFVVYDRWCEDRVAGFLLFLEEWLSISQKSVERGMILIYMALLLVAMLRTLSGLDICAVFFVGSSMWILHRRPSALRGRQKTAIFFPCFRVGLQFLIGTLSFIDIVAAPHFSGDTETAAAQIVYLIFFYMIDIRSGGERGRRRKLAWAKIKALFGTEWIPKPVPVPQ